MAQWRVREGRRRGSGRRGDREREKGREGVGEGKEKRRRPGKLF